ncbi:unnamed protein product, partial [Timema podura]|nr:unnamed protein product [Timema podura]
DYRFMPEPNLPPLRVVNDGETSADLSLVNVNELKTQLPELPAETRRKLGEQFCLPANNVTSSSFGEMVDLLQNGTVNLMTVRKILDELLNGNPHSPSKV